MSFWRSLVIDEYKTIFMIFSVINKKSVLNNLQLTPIKTLKSKLKLRLLLVLWLHRPWNTNEQQIVVADGRSEREK